MQLKTNDRRAIIEDLLDIQIFSTMNGLLKNYISDNKTNLDKNNNSKSLVEQKIELKKEYVNQLKAKTKTLIDKNRQEVLDNETEKTKIRTQVEEINKSIQTFLKEIKDLPTVETDRAKLDKYSTTIEHKCSQEQKHISFYASNDDCPTCKQHIEADFKQQAMSEANKKWTEYKQALEEIEEKDTLLKQRYETIQQTQQQIQSLQTEVQKKYSSLDAIEQYIKKIEISIKEIENDSGDIKKEKDDLKQLDEDLQNVFSQRTELISERETYEVAKEILKDEGIKSRIIKQYLPIMNKLINKYLQEMDFFVSFNLDESFEESIKSRYRDDFTYASFSEGEKMRIDLALLFTWRSIAKLKNSTNTNLLILDEVFDSSLDTDGTDAFLKIMYEMGHSTNMFVISHKGDQLYDKFKSVIKFEKKKNFSVIT